MTKRNFDSLQPTNSRINPEQSIQIIKAILLGKYCWACILFLDFLGYNPTEYIPYQTYLQVIKDNCLPGRDSFKNVESSDFDITSSS